VSFGSLFKEINSLIDSAKLTVDGQDLNTEFYLGGDYKFILLMLGLRGAISNYMPVLGVKYTRLIVGT